MREREKDREKEMQRRRKLKESLRGKEKISFVQFY